MSLKERFEIKSVQKAIAQAIVVENHYLHRQASCSYAFGLYEKASGVIKGVILYGSPASPYLTRGLCGPEEATNVIELTRLWLDDSVGKNGESFLIGNTLPLVPKEIVVSYADTTKHHLGIVYQASNFLYTGLSAKRTDWFIEGTEERHTRGMSAKCTSAELKELYGDRFVLKPRSQKHRYVYLNCASKRKKELSGKLRYPILPYPKREYRPSLGFIEPLPPGFQEIP